MAPDPDIDRVPAGRPAIFPQQTVRRFFAARNGLFLIDPARLAARFGEDIAEANLLQRCTAHNDGDGACSDGLLVPAFGVEAGYYTVLVRSTETEDAFLPLTHIVHAAGFVLGTATGDLLVCNTDRLSRRDADAATTPFTNYERLVHVTPGWYSVLVVAGIREAESGSGETESDEEWVCCFLLDPQSGQPDFTADLSSTLNFFGG